MFYKYLSSVKAFSIKIKGKQIRFLHKNVVKFSKTKMLALKVREIERDAEK